MHTGDYFTNTFINSCCCSVLMPLSSSFEFRLANVDICWSIACKTDSWQEIQAYPNIKTDHVKFLFTLASALWKAMYNVLLLRCFGVFFPTLFLLSHYSEMAFKLKHCLYSISFTVKRSTAITGASVQVLLPHPAASLHPSTLLSFHLLNELEGRRLEALLSFLHIWLFLGKAWFLCVQDLSALAAWAALCIRTTTSASELFTPTHMNLHFFPFLPSHHGVCCSMSKLERQMTQTMKSQ